jgi:GTP-binding protein
MQKRNIAIIAHVDHGKTTLVDVMFRQSGTFRDNQRVAERAMDSIDLERERGITILSKCTSIDWHETRINIVDTPGHADFGGEVERILKMVDGVVLLVDAAEGPMPQTKFVTGKALGLGLKPIVVINKVDRSDARPDEVLDEVFDLFSMLEATDEQLDFPFLYAAGRDGWASHDASTEGGTLAPLFETILKHVPAPDVETGAPFAMLATLLDADPYLGRVLTGRIEAGRICQNDTIHALDRNGQKVETARVTKLLAYRGLEREPVEEAEAGDIIAIAGLTQATVADTLAAPVVTAPLQALPVDPPTLAMRIGINDSPLAGRDGKKLQSRVIRERLLREAEGNVAIQVSETDGGEAFDVAGRGELQLGVLIETMRREGFELTVGRPKVLFRTDPESGQRLEPIEEVTIDLDDEFTGTVVEKMAARKADITDMRPSGGGKTRITLLAPSRGMIGYHGEFLTDTRGTGIMNKTFHGYEPYKGSIQGRRAGTMVSTESGKAVPFALFNLQERATMFISPGEEVYPGMIIAENARSNDLEVNPMKSKQLTNIRAAGKDDAVVLTPPRRMTLEQAIAYVNDDEVVEVTPAHIRLRKATLDPHQRKRERRAAMADTG